MFSPIPDQKSQRIAEILMQEVVSLFGIPENLLSDRGAQGAHDEHMQASGNSQIEHHHVSSPVQLDS